MGDFLMYTNLTSALLGFNDWAQEQCPYVLEIRNEGINIIEANKMITGKWSSGIEANQRCSHLPFYKLPTHACCRDNAYFEYEIDAFAFKLKYC